MKSGMNKLMSLCLVAMMGSTLIPQPIQAEEVSEFEEESFEETTVEFEEATFEEESNQVAESNSKKTYAERFDYEDLKYGVTDPNAKTVEVIGFADGYQPTGYDLTINKEVYKLDEFGDPQYDNPYTVTSISNIGFNHGIPNKIKSIQLPESITSIEDYTFAGCTSLRNIYLPSSLTKIGKAAFAGCTSLENVYFLFEGEGPQTLHLKTIEDSAFDSCTSLRDLLIQNNEYEPLTTQLETIGDSAFFGCTKLCMFDQQKLFEHLKTIGDSAFSNCDSLQPISLPEGLTTIGDRAFSNCGLYSLSLPASLTTIGYSAFSNCDSLNSISVSEGLTTIGESMFEGCNSLNSLILPEGLTTIGDRAFSNCGLYSLSLPASLTTIGKSVFARCNSLDSLVLSEGLTTIGESMFEGCDSLDSLILPEGLTTIGDRAFYDCGLYSLSLPASLTTIGKSVFARCDSLDSLSLPEGLTTIGESMFEGCNSLDSLSLPEGLTTIGKWAFVGCTSLSAIRLPNSLTTIGDFAFELYDLTGNEDSPCLQFINIPSSVETLGLIFGYTNPFDTHQSALVFEGNQFPKNVENILEAIDRGDNKPIIYFPNNEIAINAYAGENSPFVKNGLINHDYYDPSVEEYETMQLCPGTTYSSPIYINNAFDECGGVLEFSSSDFDIASVETDREGGYVTAKSPGETIISSFVQFNGKELAFDNNKFKIKVDHDYIWKVQKWPTADQPGQMYQHCERCGDKKAPVTIPPTGGGSGGGSTGGGSGGGSTGGSTSGGSGGGSSTGGGSTIDPNAPTPQVENAVYRAYNSSNGEHLYTTNYEEFKVITKNGWDDEGIAFMSELKEKGQAVYRVYNPNNGLHHYTTDVNEKNALVSLGWNDEGVAFYTSKNPKDTPVYRVYNENDGNHHYTMNANEALALISMGWKNEGIAFLTAPMK